VAGTAGARHFSFADDAAGEPVIIKTSFDGFLNPALSQTLEGADKRFLLVSGLVTSVCVLLTAAAAAQRGYLVSLVEDCCADEPGAHTNTLERYPFVFERVKAGGIVDRHQDWLEQLARLKVP
jgi:nicotinamidase-related amidase